MWHAVPGMIPIAIVTTLNLNPICGFPMHFALLLYVILLTDG